MGALIMALSTLPFLWNVFHSAWKGSIAGDNPWQALTPEWLTSSPPPIENWNGPAPLVQRPYGYGAEEKAIQREKRPTEHIDPQEST